jgi:hypothetical protein
MFIYYLNGQEFEVNIVDNSTENAMCSKDQISTLQFWWKLASVLLEYRPQPYVNARIVAEGTNFIKLMKALSEVTQRERDRNRSTSGAQCPAM